VSVHDCVFELSNVFGGNGM